VAARRCMQHGYYQTMVTVAFFVYYRWDVIPSNDLCQGAEFCLCLLLRQVVMHYWGS
jgi:hypothetical protein